MNAATEHLTHLQGTSKPPTAHLISTQDRPAAVVEVNGGAVAIFATSPADLRALADVCNDGASQLSDRLDRDAARAVNAGAAA